MPDCNTCHEFFSDYSDLAKHVLENQSTHPKSSLMWARSFTLKHAIFAKKMPEHTPYTEQDKINRDNCHRDLSGEMVIATTYCPLCRKSNRQPVEKEHVINPMAWRVNKVLVKSCEYCNKIRRF
jgi:hypothetical protein